MFFILTVILLWLKTYIAQLTEFNLMTDNILQKFLLLLNPIGSAILFLGLSFFAHERKRYIWLLIIDSILSLILYANILYYRFFTDFITLPTLTQTQNFGDVSSSVSSLLKPYDLLFFLDIVLLIGLIIFRVVNKESLQTRKFKVLPIYLTAFSVLAVNLILAEIDRPQLLTRTFDRNYIVKYLGMYNYTIYDAIQSTSTSAKRALADSSDVAEVVNYTNSTYARPNPDYYGVAEGMNVIYVHLESLQSFVIDYRLNGEEVTPFLNSLTRDSETFYFDNFFHQTAQGKTADAEFMLENSLFGLAQGSAFSTKGLNTYQAAPAILGQQGYTSAVFHGNSGSFWNRNEIYKSFGFNYFFDSNYYMMNPEDVLNYGLKDKPFFEESIPLIESLPQPFYSKFITVTNHYPYPIDEAEATIEPHHTGDRSVDSYFQTARYLDESIKQFYDYLKQSGLYDNTVIIMYGDHYGISENHNTAMEQVLEQEITPYDNAALQRVPLFIHVPGVEGGVMHQYGGQVDILPTLLHLLGINGKKFIQFGTDLLSQDHEELVPFRGGDFVSPTITYTDGKYYDTATGTEIERNEEAEVFEERVRLKLELSDKLVNGDLLRFYTPTGFNPVDPTEYQYKTDNEIED